jgi:uncharacterized protein
MSEQDPRQFPSEPSPDSPAAQPAFVSVSGTPPDDSTTTFSSGQFPGPAPLPQLDRQIPAEFRVPWGGLDLFWFLLFYVICTFVLAAIALGVGSAILHVSLQTLQKNTNLAAPMLMLAQLLVSLAALLYFWILTRVRNAGGFWQALGWRPLGTPATRAMIVSLHLVAGVALALLVSVLSNFVAKSGPVPIEDFFNSRPTVLMLMAFGILVAPLVEETMFRGFLYPVVARRFGIVAGIVITGAVFGAFHGPQLGNQWQQVALIVLVGIVLTWARARSHSVLAGYLMHVAYNSTLFVGVLIATHGLRDFSHLH